MKKQSAKDGMKARVHGPHFTCGSDVPRGSDWVEVANIRSDSVID
jgi:hypothetical protein